MLRQIISITGKPGLFKILSQGKRNIIVEDVTDGRRFPVQARDRVVSLGDIAMYTEGDDKPLGQIFDLAYAHYNGGQVDVKALLDGGKIREEFAAILPDFDRDRIYDTDLKKFFTWYNILTKSGMKKFTADENKPTDASQIPSADAAQEGAEG